MISGASDEELDIANIRADFLLEIQDLQQELQRKDNNWNELKNFLIDLQKLKGINQQGFSWGVCQEVLDKIKELEERK